MFTWGKSKWSTASFQYLSIALNLAYNESNLNKNFDHWFRDMLNFDFLEKGLEIVPPQHFVYNFSRKMFLMSYSINWPNFIVFASWDVEKFVYCNVCFLGCDVINFESNIIFLIMPFFYLIKNSRQKFKYLENEEF